MLLRMYCLFDRVAEESPEPFAMKSDAVAVRSARLGIGKAGMRPDEHRLFFIGTFDTETSKLEGLAERLEVPMAEEVKS